MSEPPYFGDCSISSLASNDDGNQSELGSIQTVELYQRLQDLEDMTANYLTVRTSSLNAEHDSYTDIEPGDRRDFEYKLGAFSRGDVLAISVNCLPNCTVDDAENLIDESNRSPIGHHPLDTTLRVIKSGGRSFDKEIVFKPSYHNGEFCFVMTVAHGVTPGSTLLLSVKNLVSESEILKPVASASGSLLQAIRVSLRIHPTVRSIPLENGRPIAGRILSGEFAYYRFMCQDPEKLVSIRVKPLNDENGGPIGDPDLYVTNKYEGLVAVTRDNCVWRSVNVGADRIDIHPHDPNAARGGAYMIGVVGYKEINEFEVIAVMTNPEPIHMIAPRQYLDFSVYAGRYSYFAMKIDPRSRGKVLVKISDGGGGGGSKTTSGDGGRGGEDHIYGGGDRHREHESAYDIFKTATAYRGPQKYGRCLYVDDELSSHGILPTITGAEPHTTTSAIPSSSPSLGASGKYGVTSLLTAAALGPSGLVVEDTVGDSAAAAARMLSLHSASSYDNDSRGPATHTEIQHRIALPMSYCLKSGIFPVVYASTSTMYPSAHDYTWRGSGLDGTITVILEADEWKYSGGICYFSVFGLDQSLIDPQMYSLPTTSGTTSAGTTTAGTTTGTGRSSESEKENSPSNNRNHSLNNSNSNIPTTTTTTATGNSISLLDPTLVAEMKRTGLSCQMSVHLYDEADTLDEGERARYKLFRYIYNDIDGASISLRDRQTLYPDDKEIGQALTYGEIEYISFQQLLRNVVASDGHIFYDLGCGTGKGLLAAALSGIKFIRCAGIEILPSLCQSANKAIEELHDCLSGSNFEDAEDDDNHYRSAAAHGVKFNQQHPGESYREGRERGGESGRERGGGGDHRRTGSVGGNVSGREGMSIVDLTIPTAEDGDGHGRGYYTRGRDTDTEGDKAKWSRLAAVSLRAGLPLLEVREGNFLSEDWSDADVVFASSISFSDETLDALINLARCLRPGAKLLTLKLPPRESIFGAEGSDQQQQQCLFGTSSYAAMPNWGGGGGEDLSNGEGGGAGEGGFGEYDMPLIGSSSGAEKWERYFELECTAWCKTTWGRMKVFVLKRKDEFTSSSSGQQQQQPQMFIHPPRLPSDYPSAPSSAYQEPYTSTQDRMKRSSPSSLGGVFNRSSRSSPGESRSRDRAPSGEWDNLSTGTGVRSYGSQTNHSIASGGGGAGGGVRSSSYGANANANANGSTNGSANITGGSSFFAPRPPSTFTSGGGDSVASGNVSVSGIPAYNAAAGGNAVAAAGGNAGDGIAALLDANRQLSYYEQGAKYLEELLGQQAGEAGDTSTGDSANNDYQQ